MPNDYNYAIEQAVYSTKAKGLEALLTAGGVSLEGITITYNGKQYVFSAATPENAARLTQGLTQFFQAHELDALPVKYEYAATLLEQAVSTSTCVDPTFKQICMDAIKRLKSQLSYTTHPSQKHIEIAFPPAMRGIYRQMFEQLQYQCMHINPEGTLVFDMQKYLREKSDEGLVVVQDDHATTLFLDEGLVAAKPVYMMTTEVDADHVRVQPFFQAPSSEVPACQFVLDVSSSMDQTDSTGETKLTSAKDSLWQLAQVFFALYPDAPLTIHMFDSNNDGLRLQYVGKPSYTSCEQAELQLALSGVVTGGGTPLIETTDIFVRKCVTTDARGMNIIVFTDGQPTDSADKSLALGQLMASVGQDASDPMRVRLTTNKFSIISCGARQPELLQQICQQFDSPILHVKDAKFAESAGNMEFLGRFLQFRDLLTCNTMVTETTAAGDVNSAHKDFIRCHGSGQFVAAPAQTCIKGAEVSFKVEDSRGHKVAEETVRTPNALALSSGISTPSHTDSTGQFSFGLGSISFVGGTRVVTPAASPTVSSSSLIPPRN